MKVKKLVRYLKQNINIIFCKESSEEVYFATYKTKYLLRNYPIDHDVYCIMNYKIKSIEPRHLEFCQVDYLKIVIKEIEE